MSNTDNEDQGDGFNVLQWRDADVAIYDREAEYMEHVAPLMNQLYEACKKHKLGLSILCTYAQSNDGGTSAKVQVLPRVEEVLPNLLVCATIDRPTQENVLFMYELAKAPRTRMERFLLKPDSTAPIH